MGCQILQGRLRGTGPKGQALAAVAEQGQPVSLSATQRLAGSEGGWFFCWKLPETRPDI